MLLLNPVHLNVAYKFWGQSLVLGTSYSKYQNKIGLDQEKAGTASVGYRYGLLHFDFHLGLSDKSILANGSELFLEQPMQFIGLYELDSAELAIKYESYFQKNKVAGIETISEDQQSVQISYYDYTRIQDIQFNYRIEYSSRTIKNKRTDLVNRVNTFPVTLGFEHHVLPWMNMMASVRQHMFVNQGTGVLHMPSTTNVNVGAQLLYQDLIVDALVSGISNSTATQNIDGANLLSQVSLTYKY